MKKISLIALFLFSTFSAFCQADENNNYLKNDIGLITTGLLGTSNTPGIMYRHFYEHGAFRLQALGTYNFSNQPANNTTNKNINYSINLRPGMEWFSGNSKFQFYYGVDVPLGYAYSLSSSNSMYASASHWIYRYSISLAPMAGLRFYFARNFYVSLEYSYVMTYSLYNRKDEVINDPLPASDIKSTYSSASINLTPVFWLGYRF